MMSVYIQMVVKIGMDHALRCHISLHVNIVQCTMQAYSFEAWKLVANRSPILTISSMALCLDNLCEG